MLYDNYLNTYILYSFNCSPIQALLNCDRNTELPSAHGGDMAEVIVPGFKGGICGRTPQSFRIDCSSSGETPETVAVVRPDGEHKVKRLSLQALRKSFLRSFECVHCRFHRASGGDRQWRRQLYCSLFAHHGWLSFINGEIH